MSLLPRVVAVIGSIDQSRSDRSVRRILVGGGTASLGRRLGRTGVVVAAAVAVGAVVAGCAVAWCTAGTAGAVSGRVRGVGGVWRLGGFRRARPARAGQVAHLVEA